MNGVGVLGMGVTLKPAHALGQPSGPGPAPTPALRGCLRAGACVPPQGRHLLCRWAVCLTSGLPGVSGCSPEAPRGGKPQLVSGEG